MRKVHFLIFIFLIIFEMKGQQLIFDNFNSSGVLNGPTVPTTFNISKSMLIQSIQTYHWNSGKGVTPGTISLKNNAGANYGPWTATGSPGGGISNVFWTVSPNVTIPQGTYTIIVSGNFNWSYNSSSQNKGFAKVIASDISNKGEVGPLSTNTTPANDVSRKGEVGPLSSYTTPAISILDNFNADGLYNGPTAQTTFTISKSFLITSIQTYHWNSAKGAPPGLISLRNSNGITFGPWTATGSSGSGIANVFWTVSPNVTIAAGTYNVIVSDNASWSHNNTSKNKGFVKVFGY